MERKEAFNEVLDTICKQRPNSNLQNCVDKVNDSLTALDLVTEKGLDVGWFQRQFEEGMTYEDYNPQINEKYNLTREQFELLKRELPKKKIEKGAGVTGIGWAK